MRIALISDLHGNEAALTAVLGDIARVGVDGIVCLGDVATLGPRPREILAMLRDLGCACILGNHDAFMLDPDLIHTYTEVPIVVDAVDWCRARLARDDFEFLRTFKATIEIELDGNATLLLFHGTPESHMQDLLATTPAGEVDRLLAGRSATVMAGGHTHFQMLRQHRGMLIVNPGSVGLPFKEFQPGGAPVLLGHAEYAVVEASGGAVSVLSRRVAVDRRAALAAVAGCDNPLRPQLLKQYA